MNDASAPTKWLFGHYTYSIYSRIMEIAAIIAFLGGLAYLVFNMVMTFDPAIADQLYWLMPAGVFAGLLVADFSAGMVHWLADNFGDEDMPVLGAMFIRPFREHHTDPKGITRHDFIEVNGNNCIVLLLFGFPVLLLVPDTGLVGAFFEVVLLTHFLGIFATNQIHKWSHMDNPPLVVRGMMKVGLIMSVDHHNVHHTIPHDRYYCITTGWMNPILEKLDFFPRLERFIRAYWPWADPEPHAKRMHGFQSET